MFRRPYLQAAGLAAALGFGAELAGQLGSNLPVLRPPAVITALAAAFVAGAFTAVLFWGYAVVLRRMRPKAGYDVRPLAALTAAAAAPLLWFGVYHLLPPAKLAWLAALASGLFLAALVGVIAGILFRRRAVVLALSAAGILTLAVIAGRALLIWTAPAPPPRANFILITLDTTRADRLGCYGYAAARTPNLDRLARRGVRFDNCLCLEPVTAPSHASIFTSLYPTTTGVLLNGMKLRDDVPTLSESFRDAGYETAAFVAASSVHGRTTGLDRGFDTYDDAVTPAEAYHPTPLAPLALARKLSLLAADNNDAERPADKVTDAAVRWLRRRRPRPFFLWLHYFDPHDDYLPPPAFVPPALGPRSALHRYNERWGAGRTGPVLARRIAALYDGEIAFVDAEVGRFLAALADAGVARRTIVTVVGDHGEAFDEHQTKYHGFRLYREETSVPFIISDLGGELPPLPYNPALVSTLDVAPTVLDLAGLNIPRGMSGRALFRPGPGAPAPGVYSIVVPEPLRKSRFGVGPLEALATPEDKIIIRGDGAVEYYDLAVDPGETENLAAERPERVAALRARLANIRDGIPAAPADAVRRDLDNTSLEKLRTLGYVK